MHVSDKSTVNGRRLCKHVQFLISFLSSFSIMLLHFTPEFRLFSITTLLATWNYNLLLICKQIMLQGIGLVYILTLRRTERLYNAMWTKICELAPNLKENLKEVHGDYEKAAVGSIKKMFPLCRYVGCFFHFCQVCIYVFIINCSLTIVFWNCYCQNYSFIQRFCSPVLYIFFFFFMFNSINLYS